MSLNNHVILSDEVDIHIKNISEKSEIWVKNIRNLSESESCKNWFSDVWDSSSSKSFFEQYIWITSALTTNIADILSKTRIINVEDLEKVSDETVRIWKKVDLLFDNWKKLTVCIWWFQTPIEGRISYNSPLWKAILWKEVWEDFYLKVDETEITWEIVAIRKYL